MEYFYSMFHYYFLKAYSRTSRCVFMLLRQPCFMVALKSPIIIDSLLSQEISAIKFKSLSQILISPMSGGAVCNPIIGGLVLSFEDKYYILQSLFL